MPASQETVDQRQRLRNVAGGAWLICRGKDTQCGVGASEFRLDAVGTGPPRFRLRSESEDFE